MENGQSAEAVAYLARSLRTDPANDIAATNLLSLLANKHLIRPDVDPLPLPDGGLATKVAISNQPARSCGSVCAETQTARHPTAGPPTSNGQKPAATTAAPRRRGRNVACTWAHPRVE